MLLALIWWCYYAFTWRQIHNHLGPLILSSMLVTRANCNVVIVAIFLQNSLGILKMLKDGWCLPTSCHFCELWLIVSVCSLYICDIPVEVHILFNLFIYNSVQGWVFQSLIIIIQFSSFSFCALTMWQTISLYPCLCLLFPLRSYPHDSSRHNLQRAIIPMPKSPLL